MSDRPMFFHSIREYCIRYPAVLSGIIIYLYLFFAIVRYLVKFHSGNASLLDGIETFDALPFLWLLAYSMIKIIELRHQYLESENKRLLTEKEILTKETQLKTLHDVARAFHHRINTPLTIINFELGFIKKKHPLDSSLQKNIESIEDAINEIKAAILEFAEASTIPPNSNEKQQSH
ncbi:MAG: hypothetical protein N3A63_00500 [Bacteroidetes bacterium]|nr:hypothetical protein [Bacteroidota bacterium]